MVESSEDPDVDLRSFYRLAGTGWPKRDAGHYLLDARAFDSLLPNLYHSLCLPFLLPSVVHLVYELSN